MIKEIEHSGHVLISSNGFDIIDCIKCGHKHINPIPTEEELEYVYKHEYYTKDKPNYIGENIQDKRWWEMTYNRRFEIFENSLSPDRRKMLDIGSGPGVFLETGNKRNWITTGIEPNNKAAEHCIKKGLDIKNVMFNSQTSKALAKFDVINLSLVLEHIADPRGMIELVYNQLNEKGLICIVVPNDFNPFQMILQNYLGFEPWWVSPPHHINYFDFNSLGKLLDRCGFEVIHKESTFPIDMFLLMGDNYIDDNSVGRSCHQKRMNLETAVVKSGNADLLSQFYQLMGDIGIGREVLMVAKKKICE
jgi:SAM-dependent methyltransferase